MEACRKRVMVIGLDGATFDLLIPWMKAGELPNLRRLYDEGASAELLSTIPPWTGPAWLSFSTGKNPGKHGIYDFFKVRNYQRKIVSSRDVRSKQIWEILSEAGQQVIVINSPVSYPPPRVNGALISGMLTPSLDSDFTYPPGLKQEILERNYKIGVELEPGARSNVARSFAFTKDESLIRPLIEMLNDLERTRAEIAFWLMGRYDWDFLFVMFESGDRLQHYFWTDETLCIVLKHYKKLDELVGGFLRTADDGTTIVVLSDHGFAPVEKKLYINSVLMDLGMLAPQRFSSLKSRGLGLGRKAAEFLGGLNFPVEKILTSKPVFRLYHRMFSPSFDFTRTKAFLLNETSQGIWLNTIGREPTGVVSPEEAKEVQQFLIDRLNSLEDPETGQPVLRAYRREDVYRGPFVNHAPDVILKMNKGYRIDPTIRAADHLLRKNGFLKKVERGESNAEHAMEGIFMMWGPGIRRTKLGRRPNIWDVMPTILRIMGVSAPEDVDGKIIDDAFEETKSGSPARSS